MKKPSLITPVITLLAWLPAVVMAGSASIQREGAGPYFRLTLPQALHSSAQDAQLGDLRVVDAKGQALPWAWAPEPNPQANSKRQAISLFPLPQSARSNTAKPSTGSALPAQITLHPDGSVQWKGASPAPSAPASAADTWLLDLHQIGGNLLTLTLRWSDNAQGVFPLRLEASDDLRHWNTIASDAAVLKLQQQGQSLAQDSISLEGLRARYLRLQWLGTPLALQSAEVEHLDTPVAAPPALQWSPAWSASQCDAQSCTWNLPPHLPLDALRLDLAQGNTVASVRLLGENSVTATPAPARQHRHPFHGLRHRQEAAPSTHNDIQRQPLWEGVVWRLSLPDGSESRQALWNLDGEHYQRLRLEARQNTNEWGSTPPTLSLGTRSREIIFLAREAGPINLTWGDPKAPGLPMPATQLMPLGEHSPISTAQVNLPALQRTTPSAATAATSPTKAPSPAPTKDSQNTTWLWAALLTGLLLLGAMAYSLLKSTKAEN